MAAVEKPDRLATRDTDNAAVVAVDANESESTNVWPDEATEAAFFGETSGSEEPVPVAASNRATEEDDDAPKSLPSMEELVKRIPAETRELLDELFRVKFTIVRRVPKNALKEQDGR